MKKQWFVWEKIRRIHPMQNFDFLTYISEFGDPAVPTPAGVKYENRNVELLAKRKQFSLSGKRVAERAISDPKWFAGYLDSIDSTTAEYFAVAAGVLAADLSKKSDSELAAIFRKIHDSYLRSHYSGLLALVTEFVDEFISNELKRLLGKKIALKRMDIDTGKAFALLSQPTKESVLIEEKRGFLGLLDMLLADKKLSSFFRQNNAAKIEKELPAVSKEFDAVLTAHWKKYLWIFFMYEGPALEKGYFIRRLKEDMDNAMYIALELEQNKKMLPTQKKLVEKIAGTREEKIIFSFPRRLVETKAYRKDAMYFGSFVFDKLCGEIGKRLGITIDQVRYMARQELFDALAGKFNDFEMLNKRIAYSVFYAVNGKPTILVGDEARKWYKRNVKTEKITAAEEFTGTPAFAGHAVGSVKIINHPNEMLKMQKGDILVSHATNPNLLPAMTKAAAIVTDVGGLTCHAAIVSREFRIPCVVGTKIATQVLKDGDLVEVDAESGIIRKKK